VTVLIAGSAWLPEADTTNATAATTVLLVIRQNSRLILELPVAGANGL
jgi:hypothetical protein